MSERHIDADAYVDGVADPGDEAHLALCSRCRTAVDAARRLSDAIAAQPVPDPGDAYWAQFASRVESRLPVRSPGFTERFFGWFVPAGRWGVVRAATAVAAATFLVYIGMRGYRPADLRPIELPPAPPPAVEPAPVPTAPAPVREEAPHAAAKPEPAPEGARKQAEREVARQTTEREVGRAVAEAEGARKSVAVDARRRDDAGAPSAPPAAMTQPPPTGADATPVAPPAPAPPVTASKDVVGAPTARSAQERVPESTDRDAVALSKRGAASRAAESLAPADRYGQATQQVELRAFGLDPVVAFVTAAAARDTAAAAAAARSAGIAPNDAARMQRWLDDEHAMATPNALKAAPDAARSWLELESLAWPRRDAPGMRSALGSIAPALAASADADPLAAARARVLADWLAATSTTAAERTRWADMLKALPAP